MITAMPASPFFSGRIPQSLFDAIKSRCDKSGESKTDILVRALSAYIDHPVDWPVAPPGSPENNQRLEAVEKELQELNTKVLRLYEYMGSIAAQEPSSNSNEVPEGQMELEGIVIISNNKHDNSKPEETVIALDNKSDNDKKPKYENSSSIPENAVFVGTLRAAEILALPGLAGQDIKKITNKIRNAKTSGKKLVAVPPYFLELSNQTKKATNGKLEALWDIYEMQTAYSTSPEAEFDTPLREPEDCQESHNQADS